MSLIPKEESLDVIESMERQYFHGYDTCKKEYEEKLRWIPLKEQLPENYNCQILVKKENENWVNLRFFQHKEQFKLICKIHGYTHWRNLFL